jgi:hypothetical protein
MIHMIRVNINIFVGILLLLLTACSDSTVIRKNEDFTKVLIQPEVKDINSSIELRLDPFENNSLNKGDTIYLEAVNQSSKEIFFPANRNIQIFTYDLSNQKWVEVKNSVDYFGNGHITMPKGREGLQSALVQILPNMENSQGGEIRVAVTGFVVTDGNITDVLVSAYIDLKVTAINRIQTRIR